MKKTGHIKEWSLLQWHNKLVWKPIWTTKYNIWQKKMNERNTAITVIKIIVRKIYDIMPNDLILQRRIGISEFAIGKIVLYIVMFIFWIDAPYSPVIATGMWKHLITFGCFQYRTILLSFESCKMFSIYICKIIYIFQHLSFTIIISYGLICSQYLPALPFFKFSVTATCFRFI